MTAGLLREDLPIWTMEQFEQQEREAALRDELIGYHPDETLTDGRTTRDHLEELVGVSVTARLIGAQ